ncbi:MAG: dienelactone hydrolase family protein [Alteraurantiacibacter sp.]
MATVHDPAHAYRELPLTKIVNGASLQPKSGKSPEQIVLLLHGYGSNGHDLISFAPMWQDTLPDALFLAPHAPQKCGLMGAGYQWFALTGFDPIAVAKGTASAAPAIDAFLDRKLAQYDLTEKNLSIVGFSQGTMMALQVGLRRARTVSSIVGYSGMLTGTTDLHGVGLTKPPVLLVHGSADPLVPIQALHSSQSALERLGFTVESHIASGIGHTIDPVGLRLGKEFVARSFGTV